MTATTAENLLERFDAHEDILDYFDTDNPSVENPTAPESERIDVTLPLWLLDALSDEAARRGVGRKALINTALAEWTGEQREKGAASETTAKKAAAI